jgi:hypothetical protein
MNTNGTYQVRAYSRDGTYVWLNIVATSAQAARNAVKAQGFVRANVASVTYTKVEG